MTVKPIQVLLSLFFQIFGIRLIHRAVRKDINLPLLAFLQLCRCDFNCTSLGLKLTPILVAIRENQTQTVKYLIQKGAEVNKGDRGSGYPVNYIAPLGLAIQLENEEIVQTLLGVEGIDVNCIDRWNQPLLVSCVRLHPEYVEMLLEAGADPNIPGARGNSVLMYSAHIGDTELVRLLIKYGADVNKLNARRECAILPSVYRGKLKLSCITIGLEVIRLEYSLRFKMKRNDWLLVDKCPQAPNHCALF